MSLDDTRGVMFLENREMQLAFSERARFRFRARVVQKLRKLRARWGVSVFQVSEIEVRTIIVGFIPVRGVRVVEFPQRRFVDIVQAVDGMSIKTLAGNHARISHWRYSRR